MIEFASENVRNLFHSLPIADQMRWIELSKHYIKSGVVITIVTVYVWSAGYSEISIRLDKKFEFGTSSVDTSSNGSGLNEAV